MKISAVGIDLGKNVFHVDAGDNRGQRLMRKQFTRKGLKRFLAELAPCEIGMESCGGAHYWARWCRVYDHEVKLISPQFVRPYVKSNKNDYADAGAIREAMGRPDMRFVAHKSVEQEDIQALHRVKRRLVGGRTALVNQTRGLLLEYGITVGVGVGTLRRRLPEVLEDADNELSERSRALFARQWAELLALDERVVEAEREIKSVYRSDERCQRLGEVFGIGPQTATALVASVGDGKMFPHGRALAAWVGLVPRQQTTGGRPRLLGISKRGDTYLRTLLIHGARAALRHAPKRNDSLSRWVVELAARRGKNVAAVALANKNARIAWALLARGERYSLAQAPAAVSD
jgi:transposase